ncbi:hypothetical protein NDU88_001917 [Pleurodeles waltl]|uniref:Uncharacterized protein n=1 Tax=Pleurodeles waltl TaxID=8319 RepID=A0AAV7UU22_PLEWA|nr:hypothetical protein NDU88_001917 [Pleurodeles waltl]
MADTVIGVGNKDMEKLREQVKDLGTRADGTEKILGAHTSQQADQKRYLKQQEVKLSDLEDRSQRYKETHPLALKHKKVHAKWWGQTVVFQR